MKKKLVSTLLCVAMVSTMLAGCGGSDGAASTEGGDSAPAAEAPAAQESGESGDEAPAASADGGSVYYLNFKPEVDAQWQQIAADYTASTGVEVKVVTAASGTYEEVLKSEIAGSDAPTLFQINGPVGYNSWKDYCMDLSNTEMFKNLSDQSLAVYGEDGKPYGVPYTVEAYGIIYNDAIMQAYFAMDGAAAKSIDEINSFDKLKAVVEDMQAKKDDLGITGVFASTSLLPGEDWRWQTHLANLPVYYELKEKGITDTDALEFKYSDNFKNIFDLYINNSTCAPTLLGSKAVTDSMAEFALGECAGEDTQGLCIGTENFWCINSQADAADIKATEDFVAWLISSDEGKNIMVNTLGNAAPFSTFTDAEKPSDPLAKEMYASMESGKTSVSWNFTIFPSQDFKDDFGAALLEYCNGNMEWDAVKDTVVTRWAEEKAATAN